MIPTDKPPYPGLRPFERDESHLFFGRDHCVDDMVRRLAERRFLAVLGSSGTGKSSLVRTGLFSALEMGLLSGAGSRWLIVDFKPGGDPLGNLARALLEAECAAKRRPEPGTPEIAALQKRLKQGSRRELIKWCREDHLPEGTNLLVLVDQFEELFRYHNAEWREDGQALVALLLESRWPRGLASPQRAETPIYITITMRSEYLGACALIWGLPEAINEGTYLTPRMKRQACEKAILGPARVCGLDVEPQLVTRLLNDMADFAPWDVEGGTDQLTRLARSADQLPLMQHALNQMWRRASERRLGDEEIVLKLADYRGLERELDSHAEEVFASLDAAGQAKAERVFRAVTQGTTLANAVRRPTRYGPPRQPQDGEPHGGGQSRSRQPQDGEAQDEQDNLIDICGGPQSRAAVAHVLAAFGPGGCQFLTANPRPAGGREASDDAWIDIAHESLVRQWSRLSRWLKKEGQAARQWQQLKEKAENNDWLIGRALSDAKKLRKESQPTGAWAARYGGGFERVDKFIRKNWALQVGSVLLAVGVFILVSGLAVTSYYSIQQGNMANQKIEQAAKAAQKLLDQLSKSWGKGDITVRGAKEMLQVAGDIVGTTTTDTEDVAPMIRLGLTSSDLHGDLGDYTEASERAKHARTLAERLHSANPNDKEVLQLLYDSIWRIADAATHLKTDPATLQEAWDHYIQAKKLVLRLKELSPENGSHDRELMFIYQKLGDVHLVRRQYDKAEVEFQKALDSIQKALERAPNNRKWRRDAANTRRRLARALAGKKEPTRALEQLTIAVTQLTTAANANHGNDVGWSNLASAHREIGDFHRRRKKFDDALAAFNKAIAIQQLQHDKDRANATRMAPLAASLTRRGRVYRQQTNLAKALEDYERVKTLREQLFNKDRESPSRQRALALANIDFADVKTLAARDLDDAAKREQSFKTAMTSYRSAIEIFDERQFRPRYDRTVFDCYLKIGDIHMLRADPDGALKEYEAASGIALENTKKQATDLAWQERLANSYIRIGDALAKQNRAPEALKGYEKALEVAESLAGAYPQNEIDKLERTIQELERTIQDLSAKPTAQGSGAPP